MKYYAKDLTPLSCTVVVDLGKNIKDMQRDRESNSESLKREFLEGFFKRNTNIKLTEIRGIETSQSDAITLSVVRKHIRPMKAACSRYGMCTPLRVLNTNEVGVSLNINI